MSLLSTGSCGKQRDEGKKEWGLQGQRRKRNKIKPVGKERPGKSAEEGMRQRGGGGGVDKGRQKK